MIDVYFFVLFEVSEGMELFWVFIYFTVLFCLMLGS